MKIDNGNWVVTKGTWRIEANEVIKVTAKLVFYKNEHWSTPSRVRIDEILFTGTKERAQLLAQRLQSSLAQMINEKREAGERREKRDAAFIQSA